MSNTVTTNEAVRRTGIAWGGDDAVVDLASVTSVLGASTLTLGAGAATVVPSITILDAGIF